MKVSFFYEEELLLKAHQYVIILLIVSFVFFSLNANWMPSNNPYTDFLLTIAVGHFVMSKLITIKK
ncbi:hypothetical protein FZC76_05145 [Sutcliffiella horikoshii]|uniref:Uncharacterized protein n=1 Tax=Sutcliffiella horikoshii TaxID=79883 RepID=A0A5D4T6D0_9BACI|nr:hypothetical protein FZC74_14015 [Sutcliffiella horikoshii]TYS69624.1 hypothetical protein FZC76_05145 [Sutcliffiella horikoshii]TYS73811.1 hypothetical protein FZC75_05685 [Sutcliffiella horikoshii]